MADGIVQNLVGYHYHENAKRKQKAALDHFYQCQSWVVTQSHG
ncbi:MULTISPECIES: hypothetical protein [unclassified Marinomonas]|nr:hypothetical protein [Marinomonas sp. KMM3893]